MEEHAKDIIAVLIWAIITGGGLFMAVVGWIGKQLHNQLKAVVEQQSETNRTLSSIEKDLRRDLSSLDRRVSVLEAGCDARHNLNRS